MATNKTYKAQRKATKKVPIKKKTYAAQKKKAPAKKTATAPSRKNLKMYPKKKK